MKERGGEAAPDGDCDMSNLTFLGRNSVARLVILSAKACMLLSESTIFLSFLLYLSEKGEILMGKTVGNSDQARELDTGWFCFCFWQGDDEKQKAGGDKPGGKSRRECSPSRRTISAHIPCEQTAQEAQEHRTDRTHISNRISAPTRTRRRIPKEGSEQNKS